MHRVATAKAKLLLFGEHAAVSGHPALGLSLPWEIQINGTQVLHSNIPVGVGFGSSAALCVARAKALHPDKDPHFIWQQAHELEKKYHKQPSGIDTGISLFEGLCYFEPNHEALPTLKKTSLDTPHLIIGALQRTTTTADLIAHVQQHKDKDNHLAALGEIAKQALSQPLGPLSSRAHEHLRALGVSTPHLDQIIQKGIELGALGGKLSGAGGGGAYYLIAPSADAADHIAKELTAHLKIIPENQLNPITLAVSN